ENSQEFAEDDVNYDYADENIRILLREYRQYDTSIYVAEVWLSSAEYLKTALAKGSYGKNITQKTSEMASENQAILAINGDYYGARQTGYVIRNGVIYREEGAADTDVLCIYADGSLAITNSSEKSAEELVREGVWQAFSFGPGLLEDGQITVSETDEVGKAKASNPRTAIGIIDDLHYVFVVSDGRTDASEGLSLYQLAEFLQSLGVQTAYNLDGGGSSTMVLNGEIINNPTTGGNHTKERSVSDIVYITAG
ncbi:MAG: phosphodiester glycosidase family protein, partial [Erysipelotrichaceae bacterium]|nr:phosphodiester glycosidase family protein [Erysipelotrichaceae bacterium]